MDTAQTKELLLELYTKISTDETVDENSQPFVKILLEQITTCQDDPSESNMSTLMDLLHSYSLIHIEAAKVEDTVALQSAALGDAAMNALKDLDKTADKLNGSGEEDIAQPQEEVAAPVTPVEQTPQVVDPIPAPAVSTTPAIAEQMPQATQSKEEDAQRIEQIMAQLKSLNGTQAN